MGFVVSGTMYVCHNKLRKLKWQEWRAKSRAPEGRKERDSAEERSLRSGSLGLRV